MTDIDDIINSFHSYVDKKHRRKASRPLRKTASVPTKHTAKNKLRTRCAFCCDCGGCRGLLK